MRSLAACLPLLLIVAPLVHADEKQPEVHIGFGQAFQLGRWSPVRFVAPTGTTEAALVASDVDGRPVQFPLAREPDGAFTGTFQCCRIDAPLEVTWMAADGTRHQRPLPLGGPTGPMPYRQSTQFWMLVGRHPGFELAASHRNELEAGSPRGPAVKLLPTRAAEVPRSAADLESINLVVLGADPLSEEQSNALRRWVQTGGRLIVAPGDDVASFARTPLARWLPVRIGDVYTEQQSEALAGRISAFVPSRAGRLLSLDKLRAIRLDLRDGLPLLNGPTAPVITRSAYGLGIVTVVGLQLNAPPFYRAASTAGGPQSRGATAAGAGADQTGEPRVLWGGLRLLCDQLAAGASASTSASGAAAGSQLSPTGISDLQSQLCGILDDFPEVHRASNWQVIGWLALYLVLVGPVDYLLVHRVLRRPELTWFTLPFWVVLVSWWSAALAASDNAAPAAARQIEVLDIAVDGGVQRLSAWLSLYVPETQRQTVVTHTEFLSPEGSPVPPSPGTVRLATLARPEEGFRGLYRRGGLQFGGAGYALATEAGQAMALGVPAEQWSSLVFGAASHVIAPDERPLAEFRSILDRNGVILHEELEHHLPVPLENWFVVQALEATYPLEAGPVPLRLPPGQTVNLSRGCGTRRLNAYIQGQVVRTVSRKTGTDVYVRSEEYDPLGRDPDPLFRTLTFHNAIGGASYTRLDNVPLARLDLSEVIHLDRVVVFGRIKLPIARFDVDGAPVEAGLHDTYVRLVVPITRVATDRVREEQEDRSVPRRVK